MNNMSSHARLSRGTDADTIVIAPLINPEAPTPATARPTINMADA